MKYSIIVPVYNRPDEVDELLESLTRQKETGFEVIIVEDGSSKPCFQVCQKYTDKLDLHYFLKENSGPGPSRNYGAKHARGEYIIILDSDVVLPEGYLSAVSAELEREPVDAFGGPDRAHSSFTPVQKAISYSMTSFFTTGGIRGGKKKLDKFYPRSFNMGMRLDVFLRLGGFSKMRFGEDIDLSIRVLKAGYKSRLFPDAWVWHKRRTDFRKFWRQVYNSGIARINLYKRHPESLKLVHLLPAAFTVGVALLVVLAIVGLVLMHAVSYNRFLPLHVIPQIPIALYALIIFVDSSLRNHSAYIGLLSIIAAFIQLIGYGCGFIRAWWRQCVKGKGEFQAYQKTFYK